MSKPKLIRTPSLILMLSFIVSGSSIIVANVAADTSDAGSGEPETVAPLFSLAAMNVFRRHTVPSEDMFHYYGEVLGLEQISTIADVGNGGVARFKAGASQVKFTGKVEGRTYVSGGVKDATGVRLISFFYPDQAVLETRFKANNLPAPEFKNRHGRYSALVQDPDGQDVELVVVRDQPDGFYDQMEVGITVSDIEASKGFYEGFVGLAAMAPKHDSLFDTMKYSYRNGSTIISLRNFGRSLPADTGSGGVQYVVTDASAVDVMAKARNLSIDEPLSKLKGYELWTIWIDDPDGATNYFAQTGQSAQ